MSNECLVFLDACQAFIEESGYNLEYDEGAAIASYCLYDQDDNSEIICAKQGDEIVGMAIATLDYFAHTKPFGYIVKFYVFPDHRNGKVALDLIKQCNSWFDSKGTVCDFASPSARIGQDAAAIKLLERCGYTKQGFLLIREE